MAEQYDDAQPADMQPDDAEPVAEPHPEPVIVTTRHFRAAGHCVGLPVREFFTAHNLDYRDFIRNGINAEALIFTGDAIAIAIARLAIDEALANG